MNAFTKISTADFLEAKGPKAPHDPRTELRIGAAVIGLFVFGFLGWSAVARLDSAVHTPGVVKVSGSSQAVQNRAGGIVSAIHVREGDRVRAGQVLVEFATTEALAQERSLASRVFGLQAEIARITAERANAAQVPVPPEWAALNPEERDDANQALAREQSNLTAKRAMLASERAVLRERVAQVGSQIAGYRERQKSNLRQSALNKDELSGIQKLFNQGYATKTRVLALQRSGALIDGDIGATQAEIARLGQASGEASLQMMQLADQHEHDNTERLRVAQTELDSLLPQWKAARTQVAETQARAPVSGTVMGLAANTVGGVASPGQKLMEIVPNAGTLEVETQVALSDANDLKPGQRAKVNFSGLRGRNLPPLHGSVVRISADSITDERSGRSFYTAVVSNDVDAGGRPFEMIRTAGEDDPAYPYASLSDEELALRYGDRTVWDILSCEGRTGTVIFADTARNYHRGRPAWSQDRKAIFFSYFARKPRHPLCCDRSGLSPAQMANFAINMSGITLRQQDSIFWRRALPLITRIIPPARV